MITLCYLYTCLHDILLHVADNNYYLKKTVLLECIYEWYQSILLMFFHTMTVLLEYIDRFIVIFHNRRNVVISVLYISPIMLA